MESDHFSPHFDKSCAVCGNETFSSHDVLWSDLIQAWDLSPEEIRYINRQQGRCCLRCGNSLRSIALGKAIMSTVGYRGRFWRFLTRPGTWMLRILELNEAGTLSKYLSYLPRRTLAKYPEVDMQNMPYGNRSFDLVLHSDTLEHVPDPAKALAECCRVLKPGGFCCFTIPIIVDRLSRSRRDLPKSFHGSPEASLTDFIVHTEYGSDFWKQVIEAGFSECRVVCFEYPSALAIAAQTPYI